MLLRHILEIHVGRGYNRIALSTDSIIVKGTAMRLSEITALLHDADVYGEDDPVIFGITADSRKVCPGYLFAAMAGVKTDGSRFIEDAIQRGAAGIAFAVDSGTGESRTVIQDFLSKYSGMISSTFPIVVCRNIRKALGEAVDAFYKHPSSSLDLIGITGTNGKTTSAFLLRHLYNAADRKTGMLGTIEYDMGSRCEEAPLTTPDAASFTAYLAEMRDNGCDTAVVEVSSHALEQERVWPHRFSGAIFTNLTRDHLDYHGSMEAYLQAKRRLFSGLDDKAIVVANYRDPAAPRIMEGCAARSMPFFLKDNVHAVPPVSKGLFLAEIVTSDLSGQAFRISGDGLDVEFFTPLVGKHNVENCLGCVLMALGQGIPVATVKDALAAFPGVPGRLERVESREGIRAFVDYSHTDDALRSVLSVLRPLVKGKLITVFGCGGDRDPGKRPLMAKAAEECSDLVVATSDNPRTEDPEKILDDVMAGFVNKNAVVREADRPLAVRAAIAMAGADDAVLVAGKGHENYQIVGIEKRHMDDRELIRDAFEQQASG